MRQFKDFSELKQWCLDNDYSNTVIFRDPDYSSAVVGIASNGSLIYSYEKMVEWLMVACELTETDAIEFIDKNTLPAIEYEGEMRPVILYGIEKKTEEDYQMIVLSFLAHTTKKRTLLSRAVPCSYL